MSSRLTPEHRKVAAMVAALVEKAIKSVGDLTDEFELDASRAVVDVFNGDATEAELTRQMSAFVRLYGRLTYLEGMRDGGIDSPEDALEAEDEAAIDAWTETQLGFVAGFAEAAAATRDSEDRKAAQQAVLARLQMWIGGLRDIGSQGKASALRNKMGTWRIGATEKHCSTCSSLNGQRHRMSWFIKKGYRPQENGSQTLECGGWECDCTIEDDDGKVIYPA